MARNKDLLGPETTASVDTYCLGIIEERQADKYDPAHGSLSLGNVAKLTDAWGIHFGLSPAQRMVLRVAGYLHDIKRSASEEKTSAAEDEVVSSQITFGRLAYMDSIGMLASTAPQRRAAKYAVETHGVSPWRESSNRQKPALQAEKFRQALHLADKTEQWDLTAAALRRAMFVAGKRLEVGDLKGFGLDYNNEDHRLWAFLQESITRVSLLNPESKYPHWVQKIIHPLYSEQKDFISALSRGMGIQSPEALAQMLLDFKNPGGDNILESRGISHPTDVSGLARVINEEGGITERRIQSAPSDSSSSAIETVLYLSSQWQNRDLNDVITHWDPRSHLANQLKSGFKDYINGDWAADMQQRILHAA